MVYKTRRCKHRVKEEDSKSVKQITSRKQERAAEVIAGTNQTSKELNLHQTSSMRALGVLTLLLGAVVCVVQVRAEVQAVKLCGREFLRAVVYTCGGSRWRRFLSESDMDGPPTGEQSSLDSSNRGSELIKRDINNILTTVCCQVGCRKSDLTFLC